MHQKSKCMTDNSDNEVISIFKETNALLTGHFILRSGLRSGHFFQCAQVCQYMDKVTKLAELLINKLDIAKPNTIVSPAMGGLVLGQEIARQLNCRFIFLEKVNDKLALRRNFSLSDSDNVLLVEDVVTKGGRVAEALAIIQATNCSVLAVTSLVDRSTEELDFGVPFQPLLKLDFPTYQPDQLPEELSEIEPTKPGS
jgi:orotate phosphoribosyltransferase